MGLSVGEVRSRVKDALAELEGSAAEAPPPAPAAATPAEKPEPEPEPAPEARPEPPPRPEQPPPRSGPKQQGPTKSLLGNRRLLAQVGGCVLIVALLVLFATGAIDI